MRGVYPGYGGNLDLNVGSSPHARGLRRTATAIPATGGIIPACAGFTRARATRLVGIMDHPRMRGVYGDGAVVPGRFHGSSPHARGLPDVRTTRTAHSRIIPACAGFTPRVASRSPAPGDHPRMRGVYDDLAVQRIAMRGSSPHARGLLSLGRRLAAGRRIIPACAGFTRWGIWCVSPTPDHPRMRGVYFPSGSLESGARGSSPHARGLPSAMSSRMRAYRIIPACAGFTVDKPNLRTATGDHPRMRGVYLPASRA